MPASAADGQGGGSVDVGLVGERGDDGVWRSGPFDGYYLEVEWEAAEVVELR